MWIVHLPVFACSWFTASLNTKFWTPRTPRCSAKAVTPPAGADRSKVHVVIQNRVSEGGERKRQWQITWQRTYKRERERETRREKGRGQQENSNAVTATGCHNLNANLHEPCCTLLSERSSEWIQAILKTVPCTRYFSPQRTNVGTRFSRYRFFFSFIVYCKHTLWETCLLLFNSNEPIHTLRPRISSNV